jgi:hypothetical protein
MKTKHTHEYKEGKSKKVSVCFCGSFKHINLKAEDVIVEQTKTEMGKILDCPGCGRPVATLIDNTQSKGYVFILHYTEYPYVCSGISEAINRIWRKAYDNQKRGEII